MLMKIVKCSAIESHLPKCQISNVFCKASTAAFVGSSYLNGRYWVFYVSVSYSMTTGATLCQFRLCQHWPNMEIDQVGIDKLGSWQSGKICHLIYFHLPMRTPGWMVSSFLLQCGVSLNRMETDWTVWCYWIWWNSCQFAFIPKPLLQQASEVPNIASNTRRDWLLADTL